jgi:hypothetical protein
MAVVTKGSQYALTIREGPLRVTIPSGPVPMRDLRVSPLGSFVSVRLERIRGLLVIGADGRPADLPVFADPRSLTWSPDERWTALATPRSVFIFRTNTGEARVRRLAMVARDLAWR